MEYKSLYKYGQEVSALVILWDYKSRGHVSFSLMLDQNSRFSLGHIGATDRPRAWCFLGTLGYREARERAQEYDQVSITCVFVASKVPPPNSYLNQNKMLGLKATLNIIDNSGALLAECVNVLKSKSTGTGMAKVGDEIVVVIRRARPISATALASATAIKVRKGDVRRALVRTKKEVMRPDGRYIRFDDNAAVLLNNKKELLGTRIGGVVSADLRMKGWSKIASLAPKV
ncbi:ribosomal l14p/L23e domain-containing protein [Rhizoctonia solani AG-1 IA]|uniref:Large ribosomal subunit protein uL14m n=1 Tax=Thanatephorus cucumeris (strain AG1-IA) TaxID=983506 RepID=L8X2T1_THACA|nr:ribosomal l14p/L23e domain-containing protein [Rhizoctonia solani AG-1 IA]